MRYLAQRDAISSTVAMLRRFPCFMGAPSCLSQLEDLHFSMQHLKVRCTVPFLLICRTNATILPIAVRILWKSLNCEYRAKMRAYKLKATGQGPFLCNWKGQFLETVPGVKSDWAK